MSAALTLIVTYRELSVEVNRVASLLRSLGAETGDRVGIYMGMVPEVAVAMLACARLGLVHTVIFGGFAADAIRDRLNDAGARFVITQDGAFRRGEAGGGDAEINPPLFEFGVVPRADQRALNKAGCAIHAALHVDLDAVAEQFNASVHIDEPCNRQEQVGFERIISRWRGGAAA